MLEMILLFKLGSKIARIAKSKGYSGVPFVLIFIVLWVLGELGGAIAGSGLAVASEDREPNLLIVYTLALVGAAVGAVISFVIVNSLTPRINEAHPPDVLSGNPDLPGRS